MMDLILISWSGQHNLSVTVYPLTTATFKPLISPAQENGRPDVTRRGSVGGVPLGMKNGFFVLREPGVN
jgi:hypothetical protein